MKWPSSKAQFESDVDLLKKYDEAGISVLYMQGPEISGFLVALVRVVLVLVKRMEEH